MSKQNREKGSQSVKEILKPVPISRALLSVLGTFALIFGLNLVAKAYLEAHTPNRGDWLVREKWNMLSNLDQPVEWLVLGDSSCNQGIVPEVFDEQLDTTSVNLCTVGSMTVLNTAWMLDTYIQKYGAPKNVLVVHVFDVWHRSIDPQALSLIPLEHGYWRKLNPSKEIGIRANLEVFLKRYVPLYASNESLKRVISSPISSYQHSQSFTLQADGFMPWNEPNPEYVEAQRIMHSSFAREHNFEISEHNRVALESIRANAEKHNFDVFIVNSPVYEGLYQDAAFQDYYSQMRANLTNFANASQRVHFLDETVTFPKEKMENADHVIYASAKVYTRQITDILNTRFRNIATLFQE
jgi:hypothetical protein